jgi:dienelactone hydrolase
LAVGLSGGQATESDKFKLSIDSIEVTKNWVDDIPVIYINPGEEGTDKRLVIFLSGLGGTKEGLVSYLKDIAGKGDIALAFDNYRHGERGSETRDEIHARVFSNLRKYGWPILGQTVLDAQKVIDWAIETLGVKPGIYIGGISMGGDISIVLAGIDKRVKKVAAVVATPDWLRPGMHNLTQPDLVLPPGTPDTYARFFYDAFNPYTNLSKFVNTPPIRVIVGKNDNHIPPENIERFKSELAKQSPAAAEKIEIVYVDGEKSNHRDTIGRKSEWWPALLNWWLD